MKKYVNYDAIQELEKRSLEALIKEGIESETEREDMREKFLKLDNLSRYVTLDWPAIKSVGGNYYKYFNFILKLLNEKQYEEARILCILELKGLNAYLYSYKKFKNIWPQFIANNRWRKFCYNKHWLNDFVPFSNLIKDGIVTLEQCVKYPFAFTVFVRLRVVNTGYYKAVVNSKKLTINQRRDLINFLEMEHIPLEHSVSEVYEMWLRSGSNIYEQLLPPSHKYKLQPEAGVDFVYRAAKSKKTQLIKELKSCPRVFELSEDGVYPIEFIMAWTKSRKNWFNEFAKWHSDSNWKRDNLHWLKRRLSSMVLDANSAFFFYVTMDHHTEGSKLFHSLKKGANAFNEGPQQQADPSTSFPLAALPIDIIHVISRHLTLTSVMALTLTCKSVNALIKMNEETFWKHSLLITCPRSAFKLINSKWSEVAKKEVRLRQNWITGKTQSIEPPKVRDCLIFDENWGLFHLWSQPGIYRTLFDCHTKTFVPVPDVGLEIKYYNHIFLDSQPHITPTIVYYSDKDIYLQKGTKLTIQHTSFQLFNGISVGSNKLFFNNIIWDVEKATQLMKFDINTTYTFTCSKQYDQKNNTLMLAKEGKFHVLDLRSDQQACHELDIGNFDLLDEYTIGFYAQNAVGTCDLRMMHKEIIYCDPIYENCLKVLISGRANKALIKQRNSLAVQWDFRERAWDCVFYQPGHLLNMNSKQLVTFHDAMHISDFS